MAKTRGVEKEIEQKEVSPEVEKVEKTEEQPEEKKSKSIKKVVFTRKDGSTREFNAELHGKGFVEIADEFEKTNKIFLAGRQDL